MNEEIKTILKTRRQNGAKKSGPDDNGENISQTAILLNADGAAELLGFTRQYFYQIHSSGRMGPQPIKFGKRTRWSRFELIAWVQAGCPDRKKWNEIKNFS